MDYTEIVAVYRQLEGTAKRLDKTRIIARLIEKTSVSDLPSIILLLQGQLFPPWDERKSGVASRLVIKAIALASGASAVRIEDKWRETGDLGLTAQEIIHKKQQATLYKTKLSPEKVLSNLQKLCQLEGSGAVDRKVKLMAQLLTSAEPGEALYIVRTVLEDLRIGVGDSSIRDAIVWAYFSKELGMSYDEAKNALVIPEDKKADYKKHIASVQEAYDITSDFGRIAAIIKKNGLAGLKELSLQPGRPVKVMLYQKAQGISDAFSRVGKPAAFEYKYDGFRLQLHKTEGRITLYTRRLENVTEQFPDIVSHVKRNIKAGSFILDSEAVGYDRKTGKYLPFQAISQRIKRKYDIGRMSAELPVETNVFDILFYEGKSTIKKPFKERRAIIEKIVRPEARKILLSKQITTASEDEAKSFYSESLRKGNEGVMAKNLDAGYRPGSRVGFGVKIKPVMESLDLVITGAEWGEGKRAKWLTSFTLACRDNDGNLLEVGKVSTGVKELSSQGTSYADFTGLLKPLVVAQKGRSVRLKPRVIIEVNYEEIQKSPSYSSGYALRFPRFIRLREDRSREDIDSLSTIEGLYKGQRHR